MSSYICNSFTTLNNNNHLLPLHYHTTTPQLFYGNFSRTTRVSWGHKKTSGLHGAREH